MITIPIGLALAGIAFYLVKHREIWQWRQIILGVLIGLIGFGTVGNKVDRAVTDGMSTFGDAAGRAFKAVVNGK